MVDQNTVNVATSSSLVLPATTPLRVKPRVFAKALAKTNPMIYRRPAVTASGSSLSLPSVGDSIHLLKRKTPEVPAERKPFNDGQWLYGTLGDDWSGASAVSSFPSWSSHGHASRFL